MIKQEELALVATLNNGKKVLLELHHEVRKCHYRYLTQNEIDSNQLKLNGKYVWLETDVHNTIERGERLTFVTIEATPIILHRQEHVPVSSIIR